MMGIKAFKKTEPVQVAIFLLCIGEEAIKLYNTFVFADDSENKLAVVHKKFTDYFTLHRSSVFDRHQFWICVQQQDRSISSFVMSLHLRMLSFEFAIKKTPLYVTESCQNALKSTYTSVCCASLI